MNHLLLITGRYNCLWCHTASVDLKLPLAQRKAAGKSTPRSLESLRTDHQSFLSARGNLEGAKDHHNVIEEHFFDIALENVKIHIITCHKLTSLAYIGMYSWSAS